MFGGSERRKLKMRLRLAQAVSGITSLAVFLTFSMISLAADGKLMGEVLVTGKTVNGQLPVVTVNGEAVQSGRTIFSSSRVSTSNVSTATLNLGKVGTIQLAPNTEAVISFSEKGISGELLAGSVSVLSAPENSVSINTPAGSRTLNAGETASAVNSSANSQQSSAGVAGWWWVAILIGGAVAGIFIAANSDNNRVALGGGTSVVSPTR
jgi:hypothetical protein